MNDNIKAAAGWWAAYADGTHEGLDAVNEWNRNASLLADAFLSHPYGELRPLEWKDR